MRRADPGFILHYERKDRHHLNCSYIGSGDIVRENLAYDGIGYFDFGRDVSGFVQ